ncbi:MAG: hypothetical protein AB8I08_21040, partial [Sandaracinaceae bacterium]
PSLPAWHAPLANALANGEAWSPDAGRGLWRPLLTTGVEGIRGVPLEIASERGCMAQVEALLSQPDYPADERRSHVALALARAAAEGQAEVVARLLEVEHVRENRALCSATTVEVVRLLLDAGYNPKAKFPSRLRIGPKMTPPFAEALARCHRTEKRHRYGGPGIEHFATAIAIANACGGKPLKSAKTFRELCAMGWTPLVRAALDAGASPNPRPSKIPPPLMWALTRGRGEVAHLLVERGASIGEEERLEAAKHGITLD